MDGGFVLENVQTELDTDLCQRLNCRMGGNNPMKGHEEMVALISAQCSVLADEC